MHSTTDQSMQHLVCMQVSIDSVHAAGFGGVGAVVVDPNSGHAISMQHDRSDCAPYCAPNRRITEGSEPGQVHPQRGEHAEIDGMAQGSGGIGQSAESKAAGRNRDGLHPLMHASMVAIKDVSRQHRERDNVVLGQAPVQKREVVEEACEVQYLCTGFDIYLTHEPCPM